MSAHADQQAEVEVAGRDREVLESGEVEELVLQRLPAVLVGVDEDERGDLEADLARVDSAGEALDHTRGAESLEPAVRARPGDVHSVPPARSPTCGRPPSAGG